MRLGVFVASMVSLGADGVVISKAIEGKAMLFKEIGRNEHVVHSEFQRLPDGISMADAVALLER